MKFLLVFLQVLLLSFDVQAERAPAVEEITNYHAILEPQKDGSLVVSEFITVNSLGKKIKRGIFRDLPKTRGVSYRLISVRRDGRPEPSFTENVGGFWRINTGDDRFLPQNGTYTYELRYAAANVVRGFDGFDEVYWNVTGNGWDFPIANASAELRLPKGVGTLQSAAYVGRLGSGERGRLTDGFLSAGRPLKPHEGLTIAVGFEKGFVKNPIKGSPPFKMPFPAVWGATALMLLYCGGTWLLFGRDPASLPVMPRFDPPKGVTAAQAGYVYFLGKKEETCFAAALIEGAQKGFFKITEGASSFLVERLRGGENGEEKFFEKNVKFPLKLYEVYDSNLALRLADFERFLKAKSAAYFEKNTIFSVFAVLCAALLTAVQLYLANVPFSLDIFVGAVFLLSGSASAAKALRPVRGRKKRYFERGVALAASLPFLFFPFFLWRPLFQDPRIVEALCFLATCLLAAPFYAYLMHRPSVKGKRLEEHLEGMKKFMTAVHQDFPKEASFEKMDRLLPYAVLFGIEKEWVEKTERMIAGTTYAPSWYVSTRPFSSSDVCLMREFVFSALTPPPSVSSSGGASGGGGFSGGGFGGGGGGGR